MAIYWQFCKEIQHTSFIITSLKSFITYEMDVVLGKKIFIMLLKSCMLFPILFSPTVKFLWKTVYDVVWCCTFGDIVIFSVLNLTIISFCGFFGGKSDVFRDGILIVIFWNFFLIYAPVIWNHWPSTYGDGRGIAGLMCGAVTFWVPPQCRASDITQIYPRGIYYCKEQGGPCSAGLLAGLWWMKSHCVGCGPVVTNDWCITVKLGPFLEVWIYRSIYGNNWDSS